MPQTKVFTRHVYVSEDFDVNSFKIRNLEDPALPKDGLNLQSRFNITDIEFDVLTGDLTFETTTGLKTVNLDGRYAQSIDYTYTQTNPSNTWTIIHNLNKKPQVTIVDTAGTQIYGKVTYTSNIQVIIEFNSLVSGEAYLL